MAVDTGTTPADQHHATRSIWALGDYRQVAQRQESIAANLCDWVRISPGDQVLDVGTATGNVALAAAARGAAATGLDLTPRMLQMASDRAREEGRAATFVLGDAETLPFPDGSFDVVLSACGLWFAPHPPQAVAEVLRVLRPGGRLGLANFTPAGYMGRVNQLITDRLPLPEGLPEPNLWGRHEIVTQRLAAFEDVVTGTGTVDYCFGSATEASEFRAHYSPPHVAAAQTLGDEASEELFARIRSYTEQEFSTVDGVRIPAEYLLVRATLGGSSR